MNSFFLFSVLRYQLSLCGTLRERERGEGGRGTCVIFLSISLIHHKLEHVDNFFIYKFNLFNEVEILIEIRTGTFILKENSL